MRRGGRRASLTTAWIAGAAALSVAAAMGVSRADAQQGIDASRFLSWARSAAVPLRAVEPSATDGDLTPLAEAVGSARVVALGEPGHGAHQPLAFRNRLFRHLVKHDGVTAIALETSFTESRAIDDFVMGGGGDAATLTRRNLSWGFGRYEENVRLIQWMHDYNEHARGGRKLHFYGIDMSGAGDDGDYTHPGIAVRSVVGYLRTAHPDSSLGVLKRIAPQLQLMDAVGYWQMALHHPGSVEAMLGSLREYFEANGRALRHASSLADYDWAAHNLVVAGQLFDFLRLQTAPEGKSTNIGPLDYREDNVREAAMATNVLWALHEEGPDSRLLVFAHDAHVMNGRTRGGIWSVYKEAPVMMGARLRARLDGRLLIIGTLAAHNGQGLPVDRPLPGSVEAMLDDLRMPLFALDLRRARGDANAMAWLEARRPIRANFDTQMDVVPARAFDVLVFMDKITRALPNGAPKKPQALQYPPAQRDRVAAEYFGARVPAPYRWMEDMQSPALQRWVEAENRLTDAYLAKIPVRDWITRRLTELWNYANQTTPVQVAGTRIFFQRNTGLQNQSVLYVQDSPSAKPRVLIDPNELSPDGSVALVDFRPSPDGRYLAYALSAGGSDWETLHVLDVATGRTLPDTVQWVKFSNIAWTKGDNGFFYSRFPTPPKSNEINQQVVDQQLCFHALGQPQSADRLIYRRPDLPQWVMRARVSEDGRYLFVSLVNGTAPRNEIYYADLGNPLRPDVAAKLTALYTRNDAEYVVVGVHQDTLYLETTLHAPKGRLVAAKLSDPEPAHWRTVVPEGTGVIEEARMTGGRIIVESEIAGTSRLTLYTTAGNRARELALPTLGSITSVSSRDDSNSVYFGFTSYLYPERIYRYDVQQASTQTVFVPRVRFDPSLYDTREVYYRSKDGTRVPMFIVARKGIKLDGRNPTVLYGYGGFGITDMPEFDPVLPVWLELGGIYAMPNLRGGGVFGESWHQAGMLSHKQNVFDDFAWAAKYLIAQGYTSPTRLAIQGYSNGGLLTGASVTQRPSLFGAAYIGHGVLDMLRYQDFSGGALWAPEYGTSSDPRAFKWLYAYSPLQNVRPGSCYPPTLITTSWDDDRVVPMHAFKLTAALQSAQACHNPILLWTTAATSHTYMPTDKRIAQTANVWAFEASSLGVTAPP